MERDAERYRVQIDDLKAKLDFRQVYASVVADWWGQRDNFLVRQGHQPLTLVRAANA